MSNFDQKLKKYADVVVQVGLNIQPGQRLLINTSGMVEDVAPFVRQLTRSAYEIGASLVDVIWQDDGIALNRLETAPADSFSDTADWIFKATMEYGENRDAYLRVMSSDPFVFDGQDSQKIQEINKIRSTKSEPFSKLIGSFALNWCGTATASPAWAKRVYPSLSTEEATAKLWDAIFAFTRVDQPDPVAAWKKHIEEIDRRKALLNEKQYHALRFTGPGTNLTVGLAQNHVWLGGGTPTQQNVQTVPNMPTEEVFTTPDYRRVNGQVATTMPLNVSGVVVEGMRFTFENGRVTKFEADKNQEALAKYLDFDEGARQLGEVALVPHSSPISQSKTLFYNTLYDENAASHLAVGRAYAIGVQGGASMTPEALAEVGVNHSMIHIDFMIGSDQINVTGIHADGAEEPVMQNGEWA